MTNVDYDKRKFNKDSYGNLIPKKRKQKKHKLKVPRECRYCKHWVSPFTAITGCCNSKKSPYSKATPLYDSICKNFVRKPDFAP